MTSIDWEDVTLPKRSASARPGPSDEAQPEDQQPAAAAPRGPAAQDSPEEPVLTTGVLAEQNVSESALPGAQGPLGPREEEEGSADEDAAAGPEHVKPPAAAPSQAAEKQLKDLNPDVESKAAYPQDDSRPTQQQGGSGTAADAPESDAHMHLALHLRPNKLPHPLQSLLAASSSNHETGATVDRHVIIAVGDGAEESLDALQWAADNVHKPGDLFHILHVIPLLSTQTAAGIMPESFMNGPTVPIGKAWAQLAEREEGFWRHQVEERFTPLLQVG